MRNYAALLQAVAACWENAYLPEPKPLAVLQALFESFIVPGIEWGVLQAGHGCDAAIERLAGIQVSTTEVKDRLLELAEYMDDAHWCARVQKELEFDSVAFQVAGFAPAFKVALAVRGISDPLLDPRLVALVRRTFQYKRVPGLVVMGPDWRVSVADGELAHVRLPTGAILKSTRKLTMSYLTTLDQQRLGLSDIFASGQEAASSSSLAQCGGSSMYGARLHKSPRP